jgi:hypothetical protein
MWAGCISASDPGVARVVSRKRRRRCSRGPSQARGFFLPGRSGPDKRDDAELVRCWYSPDNFERQKRVFQLAQQRNVEPINIALAYVLKPTLPAVRPHRPAAAERDALEPKALEIEPVAGGVKWLNLETSDASNAASASCAACLTRARAIVTAACATADFTISRQVFWLLMLAIPIATVARTVVYEEIFREPREVVQEQEPDVRVALRAQVLLPLHLRVLLQPLRDDLLHRADELSIADQRLARIRHRVLRAGAGRQPVHEHLRAAARGHHEREEGHRAEREGNRAQGEGIQHLDAKMTAVSPRKAEAAQPPFYFFFAAIGCVVASLDFGAARRASRGRGL